MNRKCTENSKNKEQMVRAVIQKFILVLALFVMMASTAHSGAFLYEDGGAVSSTTVENKSNTFITDEWVSWDGDDTEPGVYENTSKYTGFYLGTFEGNDNKKDDLSSLINIFLGTSITETDIDLVKVEKGGESESSDGLTLTVTYDDDNKSGGWSVSSTPPQDNKINFYSVKGGENFALYYIPDPGMHQGVWTTAHLSASENQPEISHFQIAKTAEIPGIDPIPEPTTMLLFGFSLMGLAGIARRRNSKF